MDPVRHGLWRDVWFHGRLAGMPIPVRERQMRVSGSLTGFTGLGAMAATDLGAPIAACWSLIGLSFLFMIFLIVTTIRPYWVAYASRELSGFLDRRLHRDAPAHGA